MTEFLEAAAGTGRPTYFVQGNADSPDARVPAGVVSLHGRTAMLGRHSIGGLGGSNRTPFGTPFELEDAEARRLLAGLGHVNVLLSHCPPSNTRCDKAGGKHVGSVPVREWVLQNRPRLVLSGHAHESKGVDMMGETTVVNAGPLMDGNYAEIGLNGIVSVELKNEKL